MTEPTRSAAELARLRAIQAADDAAFHRVRSHVDRVVTTRWRALRSFTDADIDGWTASITPTVLAGERQIAAQTNTMLALAAGQQPLPMDLDDVTGFALRGLDPRQVYRRAGVDVWTALSQQRSLTDAVQAGEVRVRSAVKTDLQLARTHAARASSTSRGVTWYRRVLTGRENCGKCMIAATQRYKVGDLMPIHPACDCQVAEMHSAEMPPQVIDPDLLAATHDLAGRSLPGGTQHTTLADYRNLIVVNDHGELGPLLTVRGQHFTAQAQAAAGTGRKARKPKPANPYAKLTDADLEDRMRRAIELDDMDGLDRIEAELDRRDKVLAQKARKAETDRARRERTLQAQADDVTRLIDQGWEPHEAYEQVTGRTVLKQRRDEALARLRMEVPTSAARSFDTASAHAYRDMLADQYRAAEDATNGYLLSRKSEAAGVDPWRLFSGSDSFARKHASDELRQWWDDHGGRPTLAAYRESLLTGGSARGQWRGYYTN